MTRTDYVVAQKVVHWLMALLIMLDLFVAQKFGDHMEQWDRLASRSDHATLGTIVATLFVLRFMLRLRYGAPPPVASMSAWQVNLARWAHGLFYVLIAALICSGVVTAINGTDPIALFGALDITSGQLNEDTFLSIRPIHEFITNALIGLILLHIAAALYHHFVIRDNATIKMLKFWASNQEPSCIR